ncbi:MAG: pentapeptide repeat-containing protein [Pseudomonadota bacterium]
MASATPTSPVWKVRRNDAQAGPFSRKQLAKYSRTGKFRASDEVSRDGGAWRRAADEPGLAMLWRDDDAVSHPQGSGLPAGERAARAKKSAAVWRGLRPQYQSPTFLNFLPLVAVIVLSALCAAVMLPTDSDAVGDCDKTPVAARNWDFCAKAGAQLRDTDLSGLSVRNSDFSRSDLRGSLLVTSDLSYSNLSLADLSLVQAGNARLLGANLNGANLDHADLRGADLRGADLRNASVHATRFDGAALGNAIWVSGRICAHGSAGSCR